VVTFELLAVWQLHHFPGRFCIHHILREWLRICPFCLFEFIMSDNEMSPFILAAMKAHDIQNLMPYNSTLCVSLGLSGNWYLILIIYLTILSTLTCK